MPMHSFRAIHRTSDKGTPYVSTPPPPSATDPSLCLLLEPPAIVVGLGWASGLRPRPWRWMPRSQGQTETQTHQAYPSSPLFTHATHSHRCNSATNTNKPHHRPASRVLLPSVVPPLGSVYRNATETPTSPCQVPRRRQHQLMKPRRIACICHGCFSSHSPLLPPGPCRKFWNHRASPAQSRWKATSSSNDDKN